MKNLILSITCLLAINATAEPVSLSGIYPHLTMFNEQGECGTGGVVPWQGKLWVITYAPHQPKGSDDKLYSVSPDLIQTIHPESIGGTPANRMIHLESDQLFIGPYAIDANSKVRSIPSSIMFGRHTGTARHLTDPTGKVVTATMEEGIYEIDSKSLKVTELWGDEANKESPRKADLPGYHGKGFYSGQGVYIYSNNGEYGKDAQTKPETPSVSSPSGMARPINGPSFAATSSPKSPAPAASTEIKAPKPIPFGLSAGTTVLSSLASACRIPDGHSTDFRKAPTPTTARTAGTPSGPASAKSVIRIS